MAKAGKRRRRKNGENISGFFRAIFNDRPDLLESKSNRELLDLWLGAHPGETKVPGRVKQNLANVKSLMRRNLRNGTPSRRAGGTTAPAAPRRGPRAGLETLETNIDECLIMAKNLDRVGLEGVIRKLRDARNEVVWKQGQ